MSTYRGIVRGKIVELTPEAQPAEGTEVVVVVPPKGSRDAVLAALKAPPLCAPEDVDALLEAIRQGRIPTRYSGQFDE